jgi:hypothetical protein
MFKGNRRLHTVPVYSAENMLYPQVWDVDDTQLPPGKIRKSPCSFHAHC